ncbi:MAG TPA: AAA family ATPase, partial [Gemmataceae bacterium]|nr:AAA family ATPase [Gemmataceae bacterium]
MENSMATERTFISLAEVAPEQTRWLWPNRIALGAITLLEGDPGQGKSTVTYDLAARVTAGTPMPCCSTAAEPAGVLLLQSEDSPRETVRPNLQAAGGNPTLVRVNGQLLVIPDDIPAIEKVAAEISARLVVIDPLEAFFAGGITKSDSVRPTLQALVAVAERGGLAVLLVRHLTKSPSRNVLYRGAGSVAITAVARSVLRVGNDPACDDPNRHLLIQTKSNLSRAATTLAFRTTKLGGGVRIEWLGEVAGRAGDLVDAGPTDQSTLGDAIWILYCLLRERPLPAREVQRLAGDAGVARR